MQGDRLNMHVPGQTRESYTAQLPSDNANYHPTCSVLGLLVRTFTGRCISLAPVGESTFTLLKQIAVSSPFIATDSLLRIQR